MDGLRQSLGLVPLTFYGVGIIIGAGIYSVIGAAAAEAGESLWLAFLASAVVAVLTGLSYAELTTMFPKAGAEYVYLREAFPKVVWLAFFTGFILVVAGAATASTVSLSFGSYLGGFVDLPPWLAAAGRNGQRCDDDPVRTDRLLDLRRCGGRRDHVSSALEASIESDVGCAWQPDRRRPGKCLHPA